LQLLKLISLIFLIYALTGNKVYAQSNDRILSPIGQWNCVIYGNPLLGDERAYLSFRADGILLMTREARDNERSNSIQLEYIIEGNRLSFSDIQTGRNFNAQLGGFTLSGEWRSRIQLGGWWCSPDEFEEGIFSNTLENQFVGRLDPEIMASPSYPLQAIRDVLQGRVVICFEVTTMGEVINPTFIEVSDEVFRAPSLDALMRSRYKSWLPNNQSELARPACRSFIYRLDYVYNSFD
jgi:hypothetical protein